ncbi:hypothetical protein BT63DRAFT_380240 [Microthyrium microscopicum]|uniref:Uncharacterized protein n=1 Tax=Microthyrium microscopicum TaxID=703497 RepID=A0A6A6TT36_9PEZI|nr:hypothetical protein BT63DRAFT_380240 [Microthyrium microscopicum]
MNFHFLSSSPSNSLLALRIISEVSTILLWGLGVASLEDLQWALASRKDGMNIFQFLTLDMGTGIWGLMRLVIRSPFAYKGLALLRIIFLCTIAVPGVLIMSNISINQVFFPISTHQVSAGLAPFNVSYTRNLDETWATALCANVGNPVWSSLNSISVPPLPRGQGGCDSTTSLTHEWEPCQEAYFLTGGIERVAPQPALGPNMSAATAIVVAHTQGYHIEFGRLRDPQFLQQKGCGQRGDESGAVFWCLSNGQAQELTMAGVYCPLEFQNDNRCMSDTSWTQSLNLDTSIFIYRRSGTVYYDRSNFTILRVSDLSEPTIFNISAIQAIIAFDTVIQSSNNCSGISHYAATILPASDSQNAAVLALRESRAAFSLMLHYFNANTVGASDNVWTLTEPRAGLPDNMYTTASFSRPAYQAVASRISLWAFVGCESALLLICVVAILCARRAVRYRQIRTGYPSLDFAVNCLGRGGLLGKVAVMREHPSRSLPEDLDHMRIWAGQRDINRASDSEVHDVQ